ncbi:MAG: hypothetical protein V4689_22530 [Verrucomicrobiota bacterium]
MIIQPLLENAFQHQPEDRDGPLQIRLTALVELRFLRVNLSNTGGSAPRSGGQVPLNGNPALSQRLRVLLGTEAEVGQQTDNGWIPVTLPPI